MLKKNAIKVSESSLVDLKAQLFKSQAQFQKEQKDPQAREKKPKSLPQNLIKNKGVEARAARDLAEPTLTLDEERTFEESRKRLNEKAKLYQSMIDNADDKSSDSENDNHNQYDFKREAKKMNTLIDFERKKWDQEDEVSELLEDKQAEYEYEKQQEQRAKKPKISGDKDDGDWVDFVDALGRSRRCLKSDLPEYKKKDKEFRPSASIESESDDAYGKELAEKRKIWRQEIRAKVIRLEEEEKERLSKPVTHLRYTEASRGEIRQLGVGYYKFSADEMERTKQLESLDKLRAQTVNQRNRHSKVKEKREKLLQIRLEKVRQRKEQREKEKLQQEQQQQQEQEQKQKQEQEQMEDNEK